MKKTLLLTSVLLGLTSAANAKDNAKNEFFVGASVNVSKDKYNIDKGHRKAARIGINGEAIKNVQTSQKANQHKIDQLNFATANNAQLDPYYKDLTSLQYMNPIEVEVYQAILNNQDLTFEEQQKEIKDLITNQGMSAVALSNSLVNPVAAELFEITTINNGGKPQSFYRPFLVEVNAATTVQELEAAFIGYQAAAADILSFISENIPASYFENELASIYALAGFEMLSWEDFYNIEALIAEYEDKAEELQAQLEAALAHKQDIINELNSIETTASEINKSVSLFAGFRADVAKHFMVGFEAGVDLGNVKIGDKSKNELEIRGGTGFYALARMGVNLLPNFTVYGQTGLMTRKYDMSYNGILINENNGGQNITSAIYGLGVEGRISNNIAMFAEYNYVTSIDKLQTELIKASVRSEQIKIGSRYYFGL